MQSNMIHATLTPDLCHAKLGMTHVKFDLRGLTHAINLTWITPLTISAPSLLTALVSSKTKRLAVNLAAKQQLGKLSHMFFL
jgi:hypothetical protein